MNEDTAKKNRTWLAVMVSILLVLPALIPAGLVVIFYKYNLRFFVSDHWIPYMEELSLQWFPELLRGLIVGAIAIFGATKLVGSADVEVVRYSTLTFWGGISVLLMTSNVGVAGLTLDMVGAIAMLVGLACGLWADKMT